MRRRTELRRLRGASGLLAVAVIIAACSTPSAPAPVYPTRAALLDPETCKTCHVDHYTDWSGSMHAYAAEDPVFLAMNARGQRETHGAMGDFCIKCHAPMALREGLTKDGLNLATIDRKYKGVTCFFCHTVDDVTGAHDAPLHLANDLVMRGPYTDPMATHGHPSAYSSLHDRDKADSAKLCGACHDITNDHGVALERTFDEWKKTVFATQLGASCGQCHMDQSADLRPIAQAPNAPLRRYHTHAQPGVDLALTPFPETDSQKKKVQALLDTTLQTAVCVGDGTAGINVIADNVAAGHSWPSGAGQDRRAWVEVIAYSGANVVYQSGVVAQGGDVTSAANDPDLWLLRDCMFDASSKQVPMFWQAESNESYLLPGQATFDQKDPRYYQTHVLQTFPRVGALPSVPDRVTMRVRLQPVGADVLADLVKSGDLDSKTQDAMTTFDIGASPIVEWTPAKAKLGYTVGPVKYSCVTNTNLNFQAQTFPARARGKCKP